MTIVKAWGSSELEIPTRNTVGIVLDVPFYVYNSQYVTSYIPIYGEVGQY